MTQPLTKREISGIVGPLSGTASQILCVFFLSVVGQSFTQKGLANMLGKSLNTISTAVQQLEAQGWLQFNGRQNGWSLLPKYHQTPLPLIQKNLDQLRLDPKIYGSTPLLVVSSSNRSNKNDLLLTTTKTADPKIFGSAQSAGSENTAPDGQNKPVDPENTAVADWLIHGGIAAGSPKWSSIMSHGLAVDYVKAHVLEHLHEQQTWERDKNGREPGTGTLIYRLEHNWPAPPLRCPDCLRVSCICGNLCPDCGAEISQSFGCCLYCTGVVHR